MPHNSRSTGKSRQNVNYGYKYQRARKYLLANHPLCHWCKIRPATTADHEPPIHIAGGPHLNLVPACGPCNYGRRNAGLVIRQKPPTSRPVPPSRDWWTRSADPNGGDPDWWKAVPENKRWWMWNGNTPGVSINSWDEWEPDDRPY